MHHVCMYIDTYLFTHNLFHCCAKCNGGHVAESIAWNAPNLCWKYKQSINTLCFCKIRPSNILECKPSRVKVRDTEKGLIKILPSLLFTYFHKATIVSVAFIVHLHKSNWFEQSKIWSLNIYFRAKLLSTYCFFRLSTRYWLVY